MAHTARLGRVLARAELVVQRLAVLEDPPDETPETIVLLGIGQPFAPNDNQPIEVPAPWLHQDIEPLDILQPMDFVRLHPRPVEKIDVAALEQRARVTRDLR